jgi:DNA-binding response OmpR family regulator
MNILIIEDDFVLAHTIKKAFLKRKSDRHIHIILSYQEFLDSYHLIENYDIILTDLALPEGKECGLHIVRSIRAQNTYMPVIILSSYSELDILHRAFSLGASDYLIKPLRLRELEIRIENWHENIFRTRFLSQQREPLIYHGLMYNIADGSFSHMGRHLLLSRQNRHILTYLLREKETLIPTYRLKEYLWWDREGEEKRNLRIAIMRLRTALTESGIDEWIQTIRGEGYYFSAIPRYSQCYR